jgi:hypothetical protein
MKRSAWLKPKIEKPKLPKMPEASVDNSVVLDKPTEQYYNPISESQSEFFNNPPSDWDNFDLSNIDQNPTLTSDPISINEPGQTPMDYISPRMEANPSITMGFSRVHINGQILASFPAEQIEGMSPRNSNLGPGSPIYIGNDINPIGYVVSLVSNFDFNHGNALTRQIVASIDRVFIQI